jgi:hypothetical protein
MRWRGARFARSHANPFHGVVLCDHVPNYSKANTDTARTMTPLLAQMALD